MRSQRICRINYRKEFGLNVRLFAPFLDVVDECFQVLFHLVFVCSMLVEEKLDSHIPLAKCCSRNIHTKKCHFFPPH